jgi:CRISPR-associated protein (TIGR03986 family)
MAAGYFSGILEIRLTTLTPLLIGGYESRSPDGKVLPDVPRRCDGTPTIPGSGYLGALRSLHEALTGSCLRVLDVDRVPVHRHPASTSQTAGLRLAMVLDADADGRPVNVAVCGADQVVWVDQAILPRPHDRLPCTGDRLKLPWGKAVSQNGRRRLRPAYVAPGDLALLSDMRPNLHESGVLLATDTKARQAGSPVYFAVGRVGQDTPVHAISDDAWERYCKTVDGANDLRPAEMGTRNEPAFGSVPPRYADVRLPTEDGTPGPVIAKRMAMRHYLHPGQPLWVRLSDGIVTEIRLSQLWRYQGDYPAGMRAGAAGPCTDYKHLCWSCRVFGSADTSGRQDDDISRQQSYRGHVRVDDLLAQAAFEPLPWHLAPLAAPKPSAGQFYLDNTAVPARQQLAGKDDRPAANWGSLADEDASGRPRPRPIRGRKFYWRTSEPDREPYPRGRYRHQADTQTHEAALIPAGQVFSGRVCFENLSLADYGSLLAALDPRRLADVDAGGWHRAAASVGGGKPFGFGAVKVDVEPVLVQTAAGRYLGSEEEVPGSASAVEAFRASLSQAVTATWGALRNALKLDFVSDQLVWYPPGPGEKGTEEFDWSFEFFSHSTGQMLSKKERRLVVLPSAAQGSADQVLDSADGERPLPEDQPARRRGGRR